MFIQTFVQLYVNQIIDRNVYVLKLLTIDWKVEQLFVVNPPLRNMLLKAS